MYCRVVRANNIDALDIVGIATEAGTDQYRSEDAAYLDTRQWTPQHQAEAEQFKEEFGVLRDARQTFRDTIYEYPLQAQPRIARGSEHAKLKGRDRNSACPCGSGRKYKRCCGA
jgi:uncharacterized protein YecA (UPF0149 family)